MAEQKNVRRLQALERSGDIDENNNLADVLKTKMIGLALNDNGIENPSLGFKRSSGEMVYFNSENGDATYRSITDTELAGSGDRNVGVDPSGKLIEISVSGVLDTLQDVTDNGAQTSNTMSYITHPTFTGDTDIVDKKYVDDNGGLWENVGNDLQPKSDPTHVVIGTGVASTGKLEVNLITGGTGDITVTGATDGFSGNYVYTSPTQYTHTDNLHYIIDTGYYWVMCLDALTPWEATTPHYWGAGELPTPASSNIYISGGGATGDAIASNAGGEAIEAITTNGTIHTDEIIDVGKEVQVCKSIAIGKDLSGENRIGTLDTQGNGIALKVNNDAGGGVFNDLMVLNTNGTIAIPNATTTDILGSVHNVVNGSFLNERNYLNDSGAGKAYVSYFSTDDTTYYSSSANKVSFGGTGNYLEFYNGATKTLTAPDLDDVKITNGGDFSLVTKKYVDDNTGNPSIGIANEVNVSDGSGGWLGTDIGISTSGSITSIGTSNNLDVSSAGSININIDNDDSNVDEFSITKGSLGTLAIMKTDINGRLTLPIADQLVTAPAAKEVITKEYFDANAGGQTPSLQQVTDIGALTSNTIGYTSHPTFTNDTDIVDKKYVDDNSGGTDLLIGTRVVGESISDVVSSIIPTVVNATTEDIQSVNSPSNVWTIDTADVQIMGSPLKGSETTIIIKSIGQHANRVYIYPQLSCGYNNNPLIFLQDPNSTSSYNNNYVKHHTAHDWNDANIGEIEIGDWVNLYYETKAPGITLTKTGANGEIKQMWWSQPMPDGGSGGSALKGSVDVGGDTWSGSTDYTYSATVTGAQVGDIVTLNPNATLYNHLVTDTSGFDVMGSVTATDTVSVRVRVTTWTTIPTGSTIIIGVL